MKYAAKCLTRNLSYRAGLVEGLRFITPPVSSSFMFDHSSCLQTTEQEVEKRKLYEEFLKEDGDERKLSGKILEPSKQQSEAQRERLNAIILHSKNVGEKVLKENVCLDFSLIFFV